mgnify:CR=1 FL=1
MRAVRSGLKGARRPDLRPVSLTHRRLGERLYFLHHFLCLDLRIRLLKDDTSINADDIARGLREPDGRLVQAALTQGDVQALQALVRTTLKTPRELTLDWRGFAPADPHQWDLLQAALLSLASQPLSYCVYGVAELERLLSGAETLTEKAYEIVKGKLS